MNELDMTSRLSAKSAQMSEPSLTQDNYDPALQERGLSSLWGFAGIARSKLKQTERSSIVIINQ